MTKNEDTILKIFTKVGQIKTKSEAYNELLSFYENDKYKEEKAAGSLGGAVNGGTLVYDGEFYKRIK